MLDISAWEITTAKKTACDVQVKKEAGVVSVMFKPGHWKSLVEVAYDVILVLHIPADFLDLAADDSIVDEDIIVKAAFWDLRDLTCKESCGPSALQRV